MIYTVIPVFNRLKYTDACIKSLLSQTYKSHTVIIVDDGSTDGTTAFIAQHYPDVVVLKGDGNLWWTGATNMGVAYALRHCDNWETDFVLTLNNDLVVKPDYLEQLLSVSQQHQPCITGSLSVDIENPDSVHFCGIKWNRFSARYKPVINMPAALKDVQGQSDYLPTDLLPGRGVLIPMAVFKKIGLYDSERFPHYAADEDLSARAKKVGYKLIVSAKAVVLSHYKESNLAGMHKSKTLKYWYDFFFSIKSSCNLKNRYYWAIKHGKYPFFYFIFDLSRICFSQVRSAFFKPTSA